MLIILIPDGKLNYLEILFDAALRGIDWRSWVQISGYSGTAIVQQGQSNDDNNNTERKALL